MLHTKYFIVTKCSTVVSGYNVHITMYYIVLYYRGLSISISTGNCKYSSSSGLKRNWRDLDPS